MSLRGQKNLDRQPGWLVGEVLFFGACSFGRRPTWTSFRAATFKWLSPLRSQYDKEVVLLQIDGPSLY